MRLRLFVDAIRANQLETAMVVVWSCLSINVVNREFNFGPLAALILLLVHVFLNLIISVPLFRDPFLTIVIANTGNRSRVIRTEEASI